MSEDAEFTRALFRIVTGPDQGKTIDVHFNPTSLQFTIANTLQQQEQSVQQYVSQSTGKLTMDLVFDTTHDGQDVRNHTVKMAKLMEPTERIPPTVKFEWGSYAFQGLVEAYKETLEFFSPGGVPLRASINLGLTSQEQVFAGGSDKKMNVRGSLTPEPVEMFVPKPLENRPRGSPFDIAMRAGAPGAARAIAAANGVDSLRFASAGPLTVSGGAVRTGPVGFSAPVSLPAAERTRASVDLRRLTRSREDAGLATDRDATFSLGGAAHVDGPASLRADVGQNASLRSRVRFEGG